MTRYSIQPLKRKKRKRVYYALGELINGCWTQLVSAPDPTTGLPAINLIYTKKSEAIQTLKWLKKNNP